MEQNQSYGKRFWYIWGSVIIKLGIAYVVYTLFEMFFITVHLMEQTQGDTVAMMELMQSQTQMNQFVKTVMNQAVEYSVLIEGVAAIVTIGVMLIFFRKDCIKDKAQGILLTKAPLWKYIGVILMAATLSLGLNNLILLSDLSSMSEAYEETMKVFYEPPLVIQLGVLGILMPVCEELVYRGLVFRRLRRFSSYGAAAIYSSLIFAVTHGNLVQMLYGFAMGMVFCYVYEKYGSVKAPMLAHIVANVLSVIGTEYQWFDWLFANPMRVGGVTVACAAVASTAFVWMQRMEE